MVSTIHYNIPSELSPYGLPKELDISYQRDKYLERSARARRIKEAKELIEADIIPSDAEADDFYAALGADVGATLGDFAYGDSDVRTIVGLFYYDRDYSDDWLDKLTPELRRQVEIELGIYTTTAWHELKNNGEDSPGWPLFVRRDSAEITAPQPILEEPVRPIVDTYGVGTVVNGEVLPMRAEAGSPDALDLLSSGIVAKVIDDPWGVLPPEQWTHRLGDAQLEVARAEIARAMDSDEEESEESDY